METILRGYGCNSVVVCMAKSRKRRNGRDHRPSIETSCKGPHSHGRLHFMLPLEGLSRGVALSPLPTEHENRMTAAWAHRGDLAS